MKAQWLVGPLALALVAGAGISAKEPARGETSAEASQRIKRAAQQAWTITELVLRHDMDPPARQQMLLSGVRALQEQASKRRLDNLSRRVSDVTTPEQLAALLTEINPTEREGTDRDQHGWETILFFGLAGSGDHQEGRRAYLTPEGLKVHQVFTGNRYVGTGIQIRIDPKEHLTQIVIPFPGGPARKAGARPGDLIVEVDGKSMKGLPLRDVVKRLQGEEGTRVSMTVRQPGEKKLRRLDMVRGEIPFSTSHGFRRTGEESWSFRIESQPDIGYLALDDINSSTLLQLRKLEPLIQEERARALVLDLRFTQGAEMRHAALVADAFLDGGMMWRVRDGKGRVRDYRADRDCLFRDMPMVVLVGPYTGGMARALAAALQDNGRAKVVGQPTRPIPAVTTLLPLPEGQGGLLVQTGRIERTVRPDGSPPLLDLDSPEPQGSRVRPDHEVAWERKQMEAVFLWRSEQQSPEPKAGTKPPDDPQLTRAVALLRQPPGKATKRDTP